MFTTDKIKEHIKKNEEAKINQQSLYDKDIPLFMKNLADDKIGASELVKILNQHPDLSIQTFQGLHTLHYAILSDNPNVVKNVMQCAINKGLTEFPITEITSASQYENNQGILKFCYKQNKLESFKTLFKFGVFDEKSIREIVLLSMVDLNPEFNTFFKDVYGSQPMVDLNHSLFSQEKYGRLIASSVVKVKGNIKTLKKFGYDFFQNNGNGTLLHSLFIDSASYYLEDALKAPIISINNKNKHYLISSYFIESILYNKNMDINSKNKSGTPIYELLNSYMTKSNIEYNLQNMLKIKIQELTLESIIPKNTNIEAVKKRNIKF